MKAVFNLIILLIFTACSGKEKEEQLSSIDSLNQSVDSIQKQLMAHEIDTIAALRVATNGVELRIKNYYFSDTIDIELGKKMDAYKVMRRNLGPLGKTFATIKNGLKSEKEDLTKLKKDIEHGNGKPEEFDEYITFESEKINQLKKLLDAYILEKEKTMKTFHLLHKELDAFSKDQYEKNKNRKQRKKQ
jgi:hypothetical protein